MSPSLAVLPATSGAFSDAGRPARPAAGLTLDTSRALRGLLAKRPGLLVGAVPRTLAPSRATGPARAPPPLPPRTPLRTTPPLRATPWVPAPRTATGTPSPPARATPLTTGAASPTPRPSRVVVASLAVPVPTTPDGLPSVTRLPAPLTVEVAARLPAPVVVGRPTALRPTGLAGGAALVPLGQDRPFGPPVGGPSANVVRPGPTPADGAIRTFTGLARPCRVTVVPRVLAGVETVPRVLGDARGVVGETVAVLPPTRVALVPLPALAAHQ